MTSLTDYRTVQCKQTYMEDCKKHRRPYYDHSCDHTIHYVYSQPDNVPTPRRKRHPTLWDLFPGRNRHHLQLNMLQGILVGCTRLPLRRIPSHCHKLYPTFLRNKFRHVLHFRLRDGLNGGYCLLCCLFPTEERNMIYKILSSI